MRSEYTILIFNFSKISGETPSEEGIKMEFKTTFINFTIVFHNTKSEVKTEYTILMQIKKKKRNPRRPPFTEGNQNLFH